MPISVDPTPDDEASYRRILKSTSLVGAATLGTILIGIVRMKLLALMLGAAGLGLLGMFNVLLATIVALAGMGLHTSGVRQLAASTDDRAEHDTVRWSLWALTWALAIAASLLLWLVRVPVSRLATGTDAHATAVGFLGVAVALSILATAQLAVLQSFRDMRALAGVRLYGAAIATVAGVGVVYLWGAHGIVFATIALPLGGALVGLAYLGRLPRGRREAPPLREVLWRWRSLLTVGSVFVVTAAVNWLAALGVRSVITREAGLDAAGIYQAVWSLSSQNVSLVLAAIAADYFPRLSAIAKERQATDHLLNQQLRVTLLLGAPLLIGTVALAPAALHLFYSSAFVEGASMLRWQVAGDLLKLVIWTFGFLLVAKGDAAVYLVGEFSYAAVFYAAAALLPLSLGIEIYGAAAFAAGIVYAIYLVFICARRHGIRLTIGNVWLVLLSLLAILVLTALSYHLTALASAVLGSTLAAGFARFSARALMRDANVAGPRALFADLRARVRR